MNKKCVFWEQDRPSDPGETLSFWIVKWKYLEPGQFSSRYELLLPGTKVDFYHVCG